MMLTGDRVYVRGRGKGGKRDIFDGRDVLERFEGSKWGEGWVRKVAICKSEFLCQLEYGQGGKGVLINCV